MKIIVTGGCGFIGSHLVDRLVELNHEVLVIDNLSTGSIENLNQSANFEEIDIKDEDVSRIFNDFKPQIVYHLAAQIDVQASIDNPVIDGEINILGTLNILQQCKKHGVKKVIYSSSAAVYGNPSALPITESYVTNPISFYGLSKYIPENYLQLFSNTFSLDYTILRYANVYGERQGIKGEGGVISIFFDKYIKQEQPVIYGDGYQTRDFIYVKDIVEANVLAMENGRNQIYNVSTNAPINVNELVSTIGNITGTEFKPKYKNQRSGDIIDSYLDNTKIINELGWYFKYSVSEGLQEMFKNLK